ncbi:MAG: hypothetical protein ROO73_00845 [Roseivirga sp.]
MKNKSKRSNKVLLNGLNLFIVVAVLEANACENQNFGQKTRKASGALPTVSPAPKPAPPPGGGVSAGVTPTPLSGSASEEEEETGIASLSGNTDDEDANKNDPYQADNGAHTYPSDESDIPPASPSETTTPLAGSIFGDKDGEGSMNLEDSEDEIPNADFASEEEEEEEGVAPLEKEKGDSDELAEKDMGDGSDKLSKIIAECRRKMSCLSTVKQSLTHAIATCKYTLPTDNIPEEKQALKDFFASLVNIDTGLKNLLEKYVEFFSQADDLYQYDAEEFKAENLASLTTEGRGSEKIEKIRKEIKDLIFSVRQTSKKEAEEKFRSEFFATLLGNLAKGEAKKKRPKGAG